MLTPESDIMDQTSKAQEIIMLIMFGLNDCKRSLVFFSFVAATVEKMKNIANHVGNIVRK